MWTKRLARAAGLLFLLTAGAFAQDAATPREPVRAAFVVGNDAYGHAPLTGAVAGAKAIAEALRNGGFDVVYAENAGKEEMERAVETFGRKLERGAFAAVYFSGHVVRRFGRSFLAPVDVPPGGGGAGREAIDIDALIDPLIVAKPSGAVVILDAGRASSDEQDGAPGLAPPDLIQNVGFIYSAEPGKPIENAPGAASVFAMELAKAMSAAGLGIDGAFLQARAAAEQKTAGAQAPWRSPVLPGSLIVTPHKPGPLQPSDPVEIGFWDTIKSSETAADFQAYLDAYPNGRFSYIARSQLKKFGVSLETPAQTPPPPVVLTVPPPRPVPAVVKAPTVATSPAEGGGLRDCPECPEMVLIRAGSFDMGSGEMFPFEGPVHHVTIHRDFHIGRREVTFDEWDVCVADGGCAHRPSDRGQGRGLRPVINVDWSDARSYTEWLSRRTGRFYRLPTESEWEYAARAGSATSYPWGKSVDMDRANCAGCTSQPVDRAAPAGSYPPNAYGLVDMMGNAAEWVEDCWSDSYKGAPGDGSAWTRPGCRERVLRGGSFNNDPRYLRSASRFKYDYDVRYYTNGFRVVRQD